jgi:phosphatidylglycerol:prolipoprotein diacylglycerol transferase
MEFGPQAIEIGNIQIRYYGLIIVAAILVAASVAARLAKRQGKDPDHIWGAMFLAVILGIIGARLWYVLFPPVSSVAAGRDTAWYFANFFDLQNGAVAIWSGGLHIFGAFLGGFIGAYIYLSRNKLNVLEWLDIAAVALPLAQFIGRWANWVNQELYGLPTGVSWWGIAIERPFRVPPYTNLADTGFPINTLFHPLFLYEGVLMLVVFFVLLRLFNTQRDSLKPGTLFFLYLASYSVVRYALEFLRIELNLFRITDAAGNVTARINVTQLMCGLGLVIALVGLAPRFGAIQWGKVFKGGGEPAKKKAA